jgi:hypothetical protein
LKRLVLLTFALLLLSGAAFAGPTGYMGLYADADHTVCEVINPGGFYPFELWIWCLPSDLGQICAEFMICYPPNVITSTVTFNTPIISVTLGDLSTGLSVCYVNCLWDWNWPAHQLIYLTDTTPAFIEICPHPDVGVYQFANCEPGYPTEPILILNHLALNQSCVIGTENVSWGAIKSLYK